MMSLENVLEMPRSPAGSSFNPGHAVHSTGVIVRHDRGNAVTARRQEITMRRSTRPLCKTGYDGSLEMLWQLGVLEWDNVASEEPRWRTPDTEEAVDSRT